MKLLIFDTETTGLPKSRKQSKEGPNNWPHIVSISWVILNSATNKVEKEVSYIVKPKDWVIPEDSIRIHGITQEKAEKEGEPLARVLGEFLAEPYDIIVAHNMEFDYNVVDNAIRWDLDMAFTEIKKPKICTMELSRDICNLRNVFGKPKVPKLRELYQHAFGSPPNEHQLHNSLYDTKLLVKIIQEFKPLRVKMNLETEQKEAVKQYVDPKNGTRILSIRLGNTD
jgi:DNA polymerase III epsilon subunit-like protein